MPCSNSLVQNHPHALLPASSQDAVPKKGPAKLPVEAVVAMIPVEAVVAMIPAENLGVELKNGELLEREQIGMLRQKIKSAKTSTAETKRHHRENQEGRSQ